MSDWFPQRPVEFKNPWIKCPTFAGPISRAERASKALTIALELPLATWEPHDWSDFE